MVFIGGKVCRVVLEGETLSKCNVDLDGETLSKSVREDDESFNIDISMEDTVGDNVVYVGWRSCPTDDEGVAP